MSTGTEIGSDRQADRQMSLTARLATWSGRRRWRVVAAWVVVVVGAIVVGSSVGTDTGIEQETPGEAGAGRSFSTSGSAPPRSPFRSSSSSPIRHFRSPPRSTSRRWRT